MHSVRSIVAAIAIAVCLVATQVQSASASHTEADAVIDFARAQLNKPFRLGTIGMRRFDCSGLVYRTFLETGLVDRIGGTRRRARGYFRWFRERGLVTSRPKPGDLVVWGRPVGHIGIFKGYNRRGKPIAISALTGGVSKHKVHALNVRFRGYLRVRIQR